MIDFNKWTAEPTVTPEAGFREEMAVRGLEVNGEIIADGKIHRYTVPGDKARSNAGWYVMHVNPDFSAGSFGSWKTGDKFEWCSRSQKEMTPKERDAYKKVIEEQRRAREAEQESLWAECRAWCAENIPKAKAAEDDHPYLVKKGVKSHGLKSSKGSLLMPIIDLEGTVHGAQFINVDGKMFKAGTRKQGHFFPIGSGSSDTLVICEGYATGASIHEATGFDVAVALDCGNLIHVARALKGTKQIIIAADNDHKNPKNPGVADGKAAADEIGARLVYPSGIAGTDFNDMHQEKGIAAVRQSFIQEKEKRRFEQVDDLLDEEFKEINWAIEGLLPEGLAVLSGPPKLGKSWLTLDFCLAIVTGGLAAGHFSTEKGSVLLCALEDNKRRLKSRIKMRKGAGIKFAMSGPLDFNALEEPRLPGFYYTTDLPRLDEGGMQELVGFLDDHKDCKLIVLDTLAKVKPTPKKNSGNAYETDYKDMGELQKMALERHCCIIVVTHNRKTETDDPLQSVSGSTGITGVMDTILLLTRKRGASNASLLVTGRDVSEHTWSMSFDGDHGAWTVAGEGDANGDSERAEILKALKDAVEEHNMPMTPKDLFDFMGGVDLAPKQGTIRQTLNRAFNDGLLTNVKGRYTHKISV